MPATTHEIRATATDPQLNALLAGLGAGGRNNNPPAYSPLAYSRHFNQVEEFFIRGRREYSVPQLPIHHDVRNPEPEADYLLRLREVVGELIALAPELLAGLTYLFDPAEILRPAFFQAYQVGQRPYLYLLRLDLAYRPQSHRVSGPGSNDRTPAYSTRELYLEASLIPLERTETDGGRGQRFLVEQAISDTWVAETGRGYFVQGIWMDNDLTRFFSRLFLPVDKRTYPYFPYVCKYKALCRSLIRFPPAARQSALSQLDQAYGFLKPVMSEVEASLRGSEFSETDPFFRGLKRRVPPEWYRAWDGVKVDSYLNERDMKEFRIEDTSG
jgi:hypothetical protein